MKEADETVEDLQRIRETARKGIEELKRVIDDPEVSAETKIKALSELRSLARTLLSGGLE